MAKLQLILEGPGGELARFDVLQSGFEGPIDLPDEMERDHILRDALSNLQPGDTIRIIEEA